MINLDTLPIVYVNRKYWLNGSVMFNGTKRPNGPNGPTTSSLLLQKETSPETRERMCCLGFACVQNAGLTPAEIYDAPYPWDTFSGEKNILGCNDPGRRELLRGMAQVNDNRELTQSNREGILRTLAPGLGFQMQFVGPDFYPDGVDPEIGRPPDEFMPEALRSQQTTAVPTACVTAVPTPPPPAPRLAPSLLNFF